MKIEELERLAKDKIAEWNTSKARKFGLSEPIVQFGQPSKLPRTFPIAVQYVGTNAKGQHVYNAKATDILKFCDRHHEEWEGVEE